jgi:starvation-inducible DNA-binding protein
MAKERAPQHATTSRASVGAGRSEPTLHQRTGENQPVGRTAKLPIALDEKTCAASLELLNRIVADSTTLLDLYKKHHWQAAGEMFYQLHPLFDKHLNEQLELVAAIGERIRLLGGAGIAMAAGVAGTTTIPRPPRGWEDVPVQLSRLLEAHERVLKQLRTAARLTAEAGDYGTNDLLVSDVIRTNERQVWSIAEHLVDAPPVRAEEAEAAGR